MLQDNISFDLTVNLEDVATGLKWPPRRFDERDERLETLNSLWRGDFSSFKIKHEVSVNYFHSYSTKVANLLLMSEPEVPSAPDLDLNEAAYDAIIDQTRYGGCLLRWDGQEMMVPDVATWYPLVDGGAVLARPYVSADAKTSAADRINFVFILPEGGGTYSQTFGWTRTTIGQEIEAQESLEPSFLEIVPRLPRNGIWGTAKYVELCGPVIEIARRISTNRRVLDIYTNPLPTFRQSTMDAKTRFGVEPTDTYEEEQAKIVRSMNAMLEQGVISIEDIVADLTFLQPNVQGVMTALAQVTEMKESIQSLTGLPSLAGPHQPPPSGEALKRVLLHFYAETLAMQNNIRAAFERILGVPVEWRHVFEVMEEEAVQRQMENMMMAAAQVREAPPPEPDDSI